MARVSDFKKSIKVGEKTHDALRVHVAKKKIGITEFVEKAIKNQIKKDKSGD